VTSAKDPTSVRIRQDVNVPQRQVQGENLGQKGQTHPVDIVGSSTPLAAATRVLIANISTPLNGK
jgi:hypothetical protein